MVFVEKIVFGICLHWYPPGNCAGGFNHPVDPTKMLLLNPAQLFTLDVN